MLVDDTAEDETLFQQITTRPSDWDSKGRLAVLPKSQPRAGATEPKRTMKALGLPSPDRADAVFGVMFVGPHLTGAITRETVERAEVGQSPVATPRVRF